MTEICMSAGKYVMMSVVSMALIAAAYALGMWSGARRAADAYDERILRKMEKKI